VTSSLKGVRVREGGWNTETLGRHASYDSAKPLPRHRGSGGPGIWSNSTPSCIVSGADERGGGKKIRVHKWGCLRHVCRRYVSINGGKGDDVIITKNWKNKGTTPAMVTV